MRRFFIAVLSTVASCGAPSNPENGPVVLKCSGTTTAPGRAILSETKIYRVDGKRKSLKTWNADDAVWVDNVGTFRINAVRITYYEKIGFMGATIVVTRFNRANGKVKVQKIANKITTKFEGKCKPVQDPRSD